MEAFVRTCYRWNAPPPAAPGYALFLPVPGDLPVLLELALDACARQDPEHLVETLVIPDRATPAVVEIVERWGGAHRGRPLRLVEMQAHDRRLVETLVHPQVNYWLQLVRGALATRATHAVLHDADLFLTSPDLLKTHYETCAARGLACFGVSPVWDAWFREQGFDHVVATWEMVFALEWLRSFEPWRHMGHEDVVDGRRHEFDVTLWPQARTPAGRIDRRRDETGFVHFNYVIGTYRLFQRAEGPYEDEYFRLLLVRLLIDAYDRSAWRYDVPSVEELSRGLTDPLARVTYRQPSTAAHYASFRAKLQQLLESGLASEEQTAVMRRGVAPFDAAWP